MAILLGSEPSSEALEESDPPRGGSSEPEVPATFGDPSNSPLNALLEGGYAEALDRFEAGCEGELEHSDSCGSNLFSDDLYHLSGSLVELCELGSHCPIDSDYHYPSAEQAERALSRALKVVDRYQKFRLTGYGNHGVGLIETVILAISEGGVYSSHFPRILGRDDAEDVLRALAEGGFIDCEYLITARLENGKLSRVGEPRVDWNSYDSKLKRRVLNSSLKLTDRGMALVNEIMGGYFLRFALSDLNRAYGRVVALREGVRDIQLNVKRAAAELSGSPKKVAALLEDLELFAGLAGKFSSTPSVAVTVHLHRELDISRRRELRLSKSLIELGVLTPSSGEGTDPGYSFNPQILTLAGGLPFIREELSRASNLTI